MENDAEFDAAADLASLHGAVDGYATPTKGEWLYHLALGLGAGVMVLAQGMDAPWSLILSLVFLMMIPLLISWWRATHGWWVSGYAPRATRGVMVVLLLGFVAAALWSFVASNVLISAGLAAATTALVTILGFVWMRVWRRSLASRAS